MTLPDAVPQTMKVIEIPQYGDADVLRLADRPVPDEEIIYA